MRRTKIVATLGPATDGQEAALVAAGLDVARLNFSHGEPEEHARRAAAIRQAAADQGRSVAILQDLQGPKVRVGRLQGGGPVALVEGQELGITTQEVLGTAALVSCTYAGLPDDVRPGDALLLNDGAIRLKVLSVEGDTVRTRVEAGGLLGEHKGINLPGVAVSAPALTEKDRADLKFGLDVLRADYVALSFVRSAIEVRDARVLVRALGHAVPCIAKLEKAEAIAELDAILHAADGVMVARGDLGVELAPEAVPMLQKRIIRRANARGIPVITATQMLESMTDAETPTRAEATDVANAVWDGTDAVMLSGETAVGRHPLLVASMMDRLVRTAETEGEEELPERRRRSDVRLSQGGQAAAVTLAARVLAEEIGARAVLGVTGTGRTAELLSRGRASTPIYAFSADAAVCRRLALWWGVTPIHRAMASGLEMRIAEMEATLLERGLLEAGDAVVVTGVHPYQPGRPANFVKYHVLGRGERGGSEVSAGERVPGRGRGAPADEVGWALEDSNL